MKQQKVLQIAAMRLRTDGYLVYNNFLEFRPLDEAGSQWLRPIKKVLLESGYRVHEARYRADWGRCGYPGGRTHFHLLRP